MKFGKKLRYECVSEWRAKYMAYGKLKKCLRSLYTSNGKPPKNKNKSRTLSISFFGSGSGGNGNSNGDSSGSNNGSGSNSPIMNNSMDPERQPLISSYQHHHNDSLPIDLATLPSSNEEKDKFFISRLMEECAMVNDFFRLKENDIIGHYNKLTEHASIILKEKNPNPKLLKSIRRAFMEIYQGLSMIENYVTLNHMGFQKILKKFDKCASKIYKETTLLAIESEPFMASNQWKNMRNDVELLYCKIFDIDRISTAKQKLSPKSSSNSSDYHMMKLGLAIGCTLTLLTLLIVLFTSGHVNVHPDWDRFVSVIPVFRGVALPILAVWLWGINVWIWENQRVNHVLIFGLDPRTTVCHRRIFKTASFLTFIFLATYFLFCGTITGNFTLGAIPAQVYPMALVIFSLLVMLFPLRFFHRKSRLVLLTTLGNVFITPFGSIKFRALYLGDVLTSMVRTIFDWEYTACYFITGDWEVNDGKRCNRSNQIALPVISGLPLLWRMMQCMLLYRETRNKLHLGNTGKYAFGFCVVLFSSLEGNYSRYPEPWTPGRIVWCVLFVMATLYMYVWDVFVDWRLMWRGSPRPMLRKHLIFKKYMWAYYYAIISDLFLRFAWTLTVTPFVFNVGISNELFVTILATVELVRRFTWSIFRVENEHIQNSLTFRAFDISESDASWTKDVAEKDKSKLAAVSGVTNVNANPDTDFASNNDNWQEISSQYYSKKSWLDNLKQKLFSSSSSRSSSSKRAKDESNAEEIDD
ncbi:hypothetical protein SAMD00019534_117930 [Acytostelium subglobosum LB1]|uniref:hypothetical protein n=1 Tax=Acytostelium subglobosum LB1 TaxID=1410327 RepID=UPI000644BAB8|nr:hypothetical protein SAMD00019534_117930 [Acytostelium subglobosum LB1]GAM28617.1 hypothetical protein SAMD00019534_117930 [Acytostelium subglobosum LB1]|eukprot:XP_012748395.1 hypothetical protein SAMD00019534_117930 [Acytostelium subglobosum LB1]